MTHPNLAIGGTTYGYTENTPDGTHLVSISVWTSTTGITGPWTHHSECLFPSAGQWDDQFIIAPNVPPFKFPDGLWHMYYAARTAAGGLTFAIGLATSPDLVNWTKSLSNPVIPTGSYADPCVIKIGSTFVMYAAPNYPDPSGTTIEFLTSSDGISWTHGGTALAAAIATDWDYGKFGTFEPFVWLNKYGF